MRNSNRLEREARLEEGGIFSFSVLVWYGMEVTALAWNKHRYFRNNEATCANEAGQDKASTACRM